MMIRTSLIAIGGVLLLAGLGCHSQSREHAESDSEPETRVFLFAGQSNMVGSGLRDDLTDETLTAIRQAWIWHDEEERFVRLASMSGSRFGPEIGFASRFHELHPDEEIYLVKFAVSGTDLHTSWKAESGRLYLRLIEDAEAALADLDTRGLTTRVAGMFWMQGEQDSKDSDHLEHARAYQRNLTDLIAAARARYGATLPFVLGRLHDDLMTAKPHAGKDFGGANLVRAGMDSIASTDLHTAAVDTDGFSLLPDRIHFDSRGQLELGAAFAEAWGEIENGDRR